MYPDIVIEDQYEVVSGDAVLLVSLDLKSAAPERFSVSLGGADVPPGTLRTVLADGDVLVWGIEADDLEQPSLLKGVAEALALAEREGRKRLVVEADAPLAEAVFEAITLGGYRYGEFKKRTDALRVVQIAKGETVEQLQKQRVICDSVNMARDQLNGPPNVIRPDTVAAKCHRQGEQAGLRVEIWEEDRLAAERCNGVLGVGQGSTVSPRMVVAHYGETGPHLCLVGKGVTFDSGGYCLKPPENQVDMKLDIAGAAMVFGAACAIARLQLPIRLSVYLPFVENSLSAGALIPGSVLTLRNGLTVQVDNTDAEGRLILADALSLAAEDKPDWLIDAATLSSSSVIALGQKMAAVYGTDSLLNTAIIDAGIATHEPFWEMPLHAPYEEELDSPIADCKNLGGKWGLAITGALFLKKMVPEQIAWAHCDIAGPGMLTEPWNHLGAGAKGFGVKMLTRLAMHLVDEQGPRRE